jgi:purine/pyrimidine-nucleoside phosphorylase
MAESAPESFSKVEVVAKANVYFDGKVVSHTVRFADGSKKTLGLIYPGEFHFGTGAPELMQIIAGTCRVRVDGSSEWHTYEAGTEFRVPGQAGFDIAVATGIAEYICSFE